MSQVLIDTINKYKSKSIIPIKDQQIAHIPRLDNDQIEFTINRYMIDGKIYPVDLTNTICIKLSYLRFSHTVTERDLRIFQNCITSLSYLIYEKIVYPFMVFINGIFIPWHFINIIIDGENYFILIDFGNDRRKIFTHLCKEYEYIQIVSLPEFIECKIIEDIDGNANPLFSFNERGEFDLDNPMYLFIPSTDSCSIIYNTWTTRSEVSAFRILDSNDIKIPEDNVFLFINGKLATGNKQKIKRASRESVEIGGQTSYFMDISYPNPDSVLQPNPKIRFDSTLLTINEGKNPNSDNYQFTVLVNADNYTKSADNISKISLDYLQPEIAERNENNSFDERYALRNTPFELKMDRSKSYADNIADAIKTLMQYNSSILNSVIKSTSNIIIEEHDGEWIMANAREDGTIRIPRSHSNMIDEFFIMLVNGELYSYFSNAYYMNNYFIIPIQGINYDDTIEFLRFQNVDNSLMNITINADDGFKHHPSIVNSSIMLYSTETNNSEAYEFPEDGLQHFPIEYTLETDNVSGLVKIVLKDEFYYSKRLKLAYRNRFIHSTFKISEDSQYDEYVINLKDRFMYCPDYSRYMVFYNGRRLTTEHYRLVLPVRPTTPFSDFKIYLSIPVSAGDRLDVFYTPSLIKDIVIKNTIPVSGDIVVDKEAISYGLSTDLYMMWINGKKIAASNIVDIDSTHLRVISDQESTNTLAITKYIPDIDSVVEAFSGNESIWDSITKNLDNATIYAMLGISGDSLTDTETAMYENAYDIKAVMHELIRDEFINNPRVDITNAFIYDYIDVDSSIISSYDDSGNILTDTMDANHDDNIPGIVREDP